MRYISKRAGIVDKLKSLWEDDQGPWENIFRLASYSVPFIPVFGWKVFILEKAASMLFDIGLQDFGRWLDTEQGKGPGSNLTESDAIRAGQLVSERAKATAGRSSDELRKMAFWGAIFSALVKILPGLLKTMLLILGVKYLSDMYQSGEMTKRVTDLGEKAVTKVKDTATEMLPDAGDVMSKIMPGGGGAAMLSGFDFMGDIPQQP